MLSCVIFAALIVSVLAPEVTFKNVTLLGGPKSIRIESKKSLQDISGKNTFQNISFADGDLIPVLRIDAIANFNQLEAIDLSNHGVKEIHARALNKLPMLQDLNLDNNNLEEIKPNVFNELKSLTRLSLNRNRIKTIEEAAFSNLHNLSFLFLSGNNLSTFYPKWFEEKPFLFVVDLTDNSIEEIPDNSFNKYDKAIFLGENRISNLTRKMWGNGTKLLQLSLRDNAIESWDKDLFNGTSIMTLDISYNQIKCLSGNFSELFVAGYISIRDNPWDCNCISEIVNWWKNLHNSTMIIDWGDAMETCNKHSIE